MTTNVVDEAAKILASDSRWSFTIRSPSNPVHAIWIVDDTDFDKIEVGGEVSFIFAGPSWLIEKWKRFARDPHKNLMARPQVVDDFSLCMVDMQAHAVAFEHGQKIVGSDHRFAGTGAYPAYQCWKVNRDAERSVKSAMVADRLSGGTVRLLQLDSKKHNVNDGLDHQTIGQLALKKGMVMFPSIKTLPVDEAIASDPFVSDAAKKVAGGTLSAEAPTGNDKIVWTDTDEARLDTALQKYFGKK